MVDEWSDTVDNVLINYLCLFISLSIVCCQELQLNAQNLAELFLEFRDELQSLI